MAKRNRSRTPSPAADDTLERYRALLRSLPDLVFIQKRDGTYTDFWAGTEQDLAVPQDKVIGANVRDIGFSAPELRAALAAIDRAFKTGRTQTYEYSLNTLSGSGHFEARIVRLNRNEVLTTVRNITRRVQFEQQLQDATRQLEAEKQALLEKNIALEQVLKHLEARAREYQTRVTREIERAFRPLLRRLRRQIDPKDAAELGRFQEKLDAILQGGTQAPRDRFASLSPRELEICDLLREGLTSKQMSQRLHLSLATIHKHREQIRNKLGFQGKRVNLAAYLRLNPPEQ